MIPKEIGSGGVTSEQYDNKQPLFWQIRTPEYRLPPVNHSVRSLVNEQLAPSPAPMPVAEVVHQFGSDSPQSVSSDEDSSDSGGSDDEMPGLEEMSAPFVPVQPISKCHTQPQPRD